MSWCILPMMPATDETHVLPVEEIARHELDAGCWCGARRDDQERRVVLHRDRDERATA